MPRDISEEALAALESRKLVLAYLFSGDFKDSKLRLWTGYGNLTWSDQVWLGNGWLQNPGTATETENTQANGISITLSGVPTQLISLMLREAQQKSTGRVYQAIFSEEEELLDVSRIFSGDLDSVISNVSPNGEQSLTLSFQSKLIRLNSSSARRWSNEDQRAEYPADKGFEYVATLPARRIYWGQQDTTRASA